MCPFGFDFNYTACNFKTWPCECYDTVEGIRLDCHARYFKSIPPLENVPHERVIALDFGNNDIVSVSKSDFSKYPALQCLDLGSNQLTMLPEDVFSNSKNLSAIFIGGNFFTKIPEQIFWYNRNIEIISLRAIGPDVKVSTLGKNWTYLTHLREFPLTALTITTPLNKQFFSNLDATGVSNMEIAGDYIPELYGDSIFEDLPNLTNLTLSRLYNLENDMIRKALWGMNKTNLLYLELEGNARLTKIYKDLFEGLQGTKLDYLSVSFSLITEIEDGAFYYTPHLVKMLLLMLPITHINKRTFLYLDKLEYLTLDSCDLVQIDYAFEPLRSLLHLDVSNNRQLQNLTTKAFKKLHNLRELIINDLHLDDLYNYTFADLGNLTLLDASFLKLRHRTYMHIGDHAFHGLPNLIVLRLIAANVGTLRREYFEPLSKVQIIRLRWNNFINPKVSPDCFQPVSSTLCRLDLEESKINKYLLGTGFLNNLTALRDLRLGTNNLLTLPNNSFNNCSDLQYVDLQHNNITHIPYVLKILEPLTILSLYHNKVMYINESAPYYDLTYLKSKVNSTDPTGFYFMLSRNPYNCSCAEVKTFIKWFNQTKVQNRLKDEPFSYICNYAPFKKMLFVPMIKFNKTLCNKPELDDQNVVIAAITVGTAYFVASAVLIVRYVFRWDISWLLFQLRWRRIKQKGQLEEFEYDAFLCYSNKDTEFVLEQLIPNLEDSKDHEKFKLALDFRTFIPGHLIYEDIINYMNRSRKTIMLLSQNFLDGNWTMWEYQIAQSRAAERKDRLIVILLESVPMRKVPRGLNKLIKDRLYIEWTDDPIGQKLFWRKMREALRRPFHALDQQPHRQPLETVPDPQYEIQNPDYARDRENEDQQGAAGGDTLLSGTRNVAYEEDLNEVQVGGARRWDNPQSPLYSKNDPGDAIEPLV